jgi:hypothetical protein
VAGGFDPMTPFRRNYLEALSQMKLLAAPSVPVSSAESCVCWPYTFEKK